MMYTQPDASSTSSYILGMFIYPIYPENWGIHAHHARVYIYISIPIEKKHGLMTIPELMGI